MTCEECQTALEIKPGDHTRAMRAAIGHHLDKCPSCLSTLPMPKTEDGKLAVALITFLTRPDLVELFVGDAADPEAR